MSDNELIIEGFTFTDRKLSKSPSEPKKSSVFMGKSVSILIDDQEQPYALDFIDSDSVKVGELGIFAYEALNAGENVFLITIHMLKQEPSRNLSFVVDLDTALVTKIDSVITKIKAGSTNLVEGTNLVVRDIGFGFIQTENTPPTTRHHFTGDLVDKIFKAENGIDSTINYYIHSRTKITYYQKEFPQGGNPIDKDGVGYGELSTVKINDHIYLLTFTKHSHGNQPLFVWNTKEERIVANFFGISRQTNYKFLVTSGFFTSVIK